MKKHILNNKNEAEKKILFKYNGELQKWIGKKSSLKNTFKNCEIIKITELSKL